ncbi:hypothetical protein [Hymenobacter sp. DG01]|uniref:hypothetical protein n=1 Tax=Hymenobacter sp. DG01 TaxID=2584940 RepID=UPI00111EC4C2|nr:hypothetical protein [Hymenobacter sp. DG01]
MATSSTEKPNLDAPSSTPPRRKIFDLDSQVPEPTAEVTPAPAAAPDSAPAPPAASAAPSTRSRTSKTATPAVAPNPEPVSGAVGKKRGPKPSAEPLEHWTVKVKSSHLHNIDVMLEDAPRHVLKQDLVDFILADFFERHKKLPEALRKRKHTNK